MTISRSDLEIKLEEFKKEYYYFILAIQEAERENEEPDLNMDYGLNIPKLAVVTFQLMEYLDINSKFPDEVEGYFEGFEEYGFEEFTFNDFKESFEELRVNILEDETILQSLFKARDPSLRGKNIDKIVLKILTNLEFESTIKRFSDEPGSNKEIAYEQSNAELNQEELIALKYLAKLRKNPNVQFSEVVSDYFLTTPPLEILKSRLGCLDAIKKLPENFLRENNIKEVVKQLRKAIELQEELKQAIQKNIEEDYGDDIPMLKYEKHLQMMELLDSNPQIKDFIDPDTLQIITETRESLKNNTVFLEALEEIKEREDDYDERGIDNITESLLSGYKDILKQKLILVQGDIFNALDSDNHANSIDRHGLTHKEFTAIRLLALLDPKVDKDGELAASLTENEIKFINDFLVSSINDTALNKKLRKIEKNVGLQEEIAAAEGSITLKAWDNLREYTHRTRRVNEYLESDVEQRFISNSMLSNPSEAKKIDLYEYGMLSDISKIASLLPQSVYSSNSQLNKIFESKKRTEPIFSNLKTTFQTKFQSKHLLLMQDRKRKSKIQGKEMTHWQKIKYFVNNRMHASVLFRKNSSNKFTESHIVNQHGAQQNKFSLDEFMYSDLYRIKLDALVTDKKAKSRLVNLGAHEGKEWQKYIQEKFIEIQREIHDSSDNRLGKLRLAGYEKRGRWSIFRHFKFKKTNFKEIRDQMLSKFFYKSVSPKEPGVEMICSEFVAHTTIAALVKLNEVLKEETDCDTDIIKIPIGKHEDLRYLTPERFVKLLNKRECLEQVKIPEHLHGIDRSGIT